MYTKQYPQYIISNYCQYLQYPAVQKAQILRVHEVPDVFFCLENGGHLRKLDMIVFRTVVSYDTRYGVRLPGAHYTCEQRTAVDYDCCYI